MRRSGIRIGAAHDEHRPVPAGLLVAEALAELGHQPLGDVALDHQLGAAVERTDRLEQRLLQPRLEGEHLEPAVGRRARR